MRHLAEIITVLAAVYPHSKVTQNQISLYAERLRDLPIEAVEQAAERVMDTQDHFPTLRALREAAAEVLVNAPTEDEALCQIEDRIAWSRLPEHERGKPPPLHEAVAESLAHVGGFHGFRSAEEPAMVRGQFLRLYRANRVKLIESVQVRGSTAQQLMGHPNRQLS